MHTLVLVLLAVSGADAAGPRRGMGQCAGIDVRAGEPFTFEGTVVSLARPDGLSLREANGVMDNVHGLGPMWYWRDLGVARPAPGEAITVEGRTIDCGAGPVNIATQVTIGDQTVDLRDPATGLPVWMGPRRFPE